MANGKLCKYCGGYELCNDNECQLCFNRSFAISPYLDYLDIENKEERYKVSRSICKYTLIDCMQDSLFS